MDLKTGISMSFKHKTDLDRLLNDIVKTAKIAGVTCDKNITWKVLNTFKEFYTSSAISIRTTNKPVDKRDVSVRYVELEKSHDPDPYTKGLAEGLIVEDGHPIYDLFTEIKSNYRSTGYGVDLDVRHGLSKIWPFILPAVPVNTVYSLSSFPNGIKNYKDHFSRFKLENLSLFALDYLHKTANVYFLLKNPNQSTEEKLIKMLNDLDFSIPPREILHYCSRAATIYYTFSWDSDNVERICFGMVAPELGLVPNHLHPLIRRFTAEAPILTTKRIFIYSIAISRNEYYLKIESDYTGTMAYLLQQAAVNVPG